MIRRLLEQQGWQERLPPYLTAATGTLALWTSLIPTNPDWGLWVLIGSALALVGVLLFSRYYIELPWSREYVHWLLFMADIQLVDTGLYLFAKTTTSTDWDVILFPFGSLLTASFCLALITWRWRGKDDAIERLMIGRFGRIATMLVLLAITLGSFAWANALAAEASTKS